MRKVRPAGGGPASETNADERSVAVEPLVVRTVQTYAGFGRRQAQGAALVRAIRSTNLSLAIGAAILVLVFGILVFGPYVLNTDPFTQDLDARLMPPAWAEEGSSEWPLGGDALGRDMVSRLIHGGRVSAALAGLTVMSAGLIGLTVGLLAGYFGGFIDDVIMRIAEMQMAFPFLVLALLLMAVFGSGVLPMFFAFTISGWPVFAKVTRGVVLSTRRKDFVQGAVAIGCSDIRIMVRHILPNVLPYIVILVPLQFSGMVLTEAGLSFVGIGIQPPDPSWGNMLGEGRTYLSNAWWLATFPGIALMITVFGANLLGDGLHVILSPKTKMGVW